VVSGGVHSSSQCCSHNLWEGVEARRQSRVGRRAGRAQEEVGEERRGISGTPGVLLRVGKKEEEGRQDTMASLTSTSINDERR
jgi:hypothetical protein